VRHWCVVLVVVCHWHKYVFLMACAPHLSFLVIVFSFIILCMAFPSIGFGLRSRGVDLDLSWPPRAAKKI
jgi:hypothetical protein